MGRVKNKIVLTPNTMPFRKKMLDKKETGIQYGLLHEYLGVSITLYHKIMRLPQYSTGLENWNKFVVLSYFLRNKIPLTRIIDSEIKRKFEIAPNLFYIADTVTLLVENKIRLVCLVELDSLDHNIFSLYKKYDVHHFVEYSLNSNTLPKGFSMIETK